MLSSEISEVNCSTILQIFQKTMIHLSVPVTESFCKTVKDFASGFLLRVRSEIVSSAPMELNFVDTSLA